MSSASDRTGNQTRAAVRRGRAAHLLLVTVVSFAFTVIAVRLFLQMTGFPQLGSERLHIAHVLWGGLLLFVACLLPLILANRWALSVSAVLSGMGVGLFIDEVGKFLTQSNDYFYPPAAPLIYGFFLLTVFLYVQVRRPGRPSARSEMYAALDMLSEALDHHVSEEEREKLNRHLQEAACQDEDGSLARLARALLDFTESEGLRISQTQPDFLERLAEKLRSWARRMIGRPVHKSLILIAMGVLGVEALIAAVYLLYVLLTAQPGEPYLSSLFSTATVQNVRDVLWLIIRIELQGISGGLAVIGALLMIAGREREGIGLAVIGLVLSLTVVDLVTFYVDQFGAVSGALMQFGALLLVTTYRRWYLERDESAQHTDEAERCSSPETRAA